MRRKIIYKKKEKRVTIGAHPSLYNKMEELRKLYQKQAGMDLNQMQVTNLLAKRIRIPNKIDILGGKNVKKQKRRRN